MRSPEKPEATQFYVEALVQILWDSANILNLKPSSVERDEVSIRQRSAQEGVGFLTKTLPALGKAFDKALASDCQPEWPTSFQRKAGPGHNFPILLGALWKLIFDAEGRILDYVPGTASCDIQCKAVRAVRQICYLLYKLEGAHAPDSERAVVEQFIATDRELPEERDEVPLSKNTMRAIENARMVIWFTLRGLDLLDIHPGHGPGSVAHGEKAWEKMNFSRFYVKLDEVYSYPEYFFFNYTHLCDELEHLEGMEVFHESTAKVVLVPKDSRGPRLISMEPLEIQWIQQGVLRKLVERLEYETSPSFGYVNFTSQDINRRLAKDNSFHGELATLDMKDASDRVSLWLVRKLFPYNVFNCLKACRSGRTELPGGHVIGLKKFAPMGSSTCFPVEALVFWALAVGSLVDVYKVGHLNRLPQVYVYGDDIILNKENYGVIRPIFEELHLKFNETKCCTGRFFRESCGLDAFKFEEVGPIRVKAPLPERRMSPRLLLSYISYVNSCRERGYERTACFIQSIITKKFGLIPWSNTQHSSCAYYMPHVDDAGIKEYALSNFKHRYNRRLQRVEVLIPDVVARTRMFGSPNWSEMLRLSRRVVPKTPFGEAKALEPCRYTLPHGLKLRWRWTAVELLLTRA